ncbi:MAG: protein kinase [Polyangiales bacterium]
MPHCAACGDDHPDTNNLCPKTGEVSTQGPCGSRIDRYEVQRWIGGGGMGAVYIARHMMLHHQVALKLLHPSISQRGDILERFLREARATASLGSRNIVKVFDCAVTPEGTAFIAMEALEGESLQGLLDREGSVAPERAVEIISQVLDGLAEAHGAGIVHRDMKPGNVFITPVEGGVRATVLDFGISKIRSGTAASLTQTGTVMGTPHYMAPEQIWNSKDIDHRADLYAVGVMLYEMLSGRLPFDAASTAELLVKACTTDPIPLRDIGLALPPALVAAVDHSMRRDPAQRYQSAREFSEGLSAAMRASRLPSPPAATVHGWNPAPVDPTLAPAPRGGEPTVAPAVPMAPTVVLAPAPRTSTRVVLIVGATVLGTLVLALLIAAAVMQMDEGSESAPREPTPSMVPLGGPQPGQLEGLNNPNGVTIVPGPGGITIRPTAGGIRLIPNGADAGILIPDDDDD